MLISAPPGRTYWPDADAAGADDAGDGRADLGAGKVDAGLLDRGAGGGGLGQGLGPGRAQRLRRRGARPRARPGPGRRRRWPGPAALRAVWARCGETQPCLGEGAVAVEFGLGPARPGRGRSRPPAAFWAIIACSRRALSSTAATAASSAAALASAWARRAFSVAGSMRTSTWPGLHRLVVVHQHLGHVAVHQRRDRHLVGLDEGVVGGLVRCWPVHPPQPRRPRRRPPRRRHRRRGEPDGSWASRPCETSPQRTKNGRRRPDYNVRYRPRPVSRQVKNGPRRPEFSRGGLDAAARFVGYPRHERGRGRDHRRRRHRRARRWRWP